VISDYQTLRRSNSGDRTLFTFLAVREDQAQSLLRVNTLLDLLPQSMFSFGRQATLGRFFPGELRKGRQFVLHILSGDSIPQSIFKREDVHLAFLDTQNLGVRKLNNDLVWPDID
jgi:hypothetical protein